MSLSPRRTIFALAIFSAMPLLVACPKKDPPVVDAGLPPAPVEDVVTTNLAPMEEDAEAGADADADAPVYKGPAVNTNVARLKQCCNALATNAKQLGSSPEASMLVAAAAQCSAMAAQIGPTGNAPELGTLRAMLQGKNVPAVCAGF